MGRPSAVLEHPQRKKIEGELIAGKSFRKIAERYDISVASLWRHKHEKLPAELVAAPDPQRVFELSEIARTLAEAKDYLIEAVKGATKSDDYRAVIVAAQGLVRHAEAASKVTLQAAQRTEERDVTPRDWLSEAKGLLGALEAEFGPRVREVAAGYLRGAYAESA